MKQSIKNDHMSMQQIFRKEHYIQGKVNQKDNWTTMNCTNCSNASSKMIKSDVNMSQESSNVKMQRSRNDEKIIVNIIELLIKIST